MTAPTKRKADAGASTDRGSTQQASESHFAAPDRPWRVVVAGRRGFKPWGSCPLREAAIVSADRLSSFGWRCRVEHDAEGTP